MFYKNKLLRIRYSILLVLLSLSLNGQISMIKDTIKINEVIITREVVSKEIKGYKKTNIDSAVLWSYSNKSLSELLAQNSAIFVKSYGLGGSATPSFRGTGASHTQLQWNNININDPMLGQPDLSLVPAGLIDEIGIYYGGSSMPSCIGGIGGMINLETKPEWRKESLITIIPGIGSFGQFSGLAKVRAGNLNFQSVTKAYIQYARNNFSYINDVLYSDPVKEVMQNSESAQKGFMQELYYRRSKNVLSARVWYQAADRNLPSSMLTEQSGTNEKQNDESLRTLINYDGSFGVSEYFLTGSYSVSKLNYSNDLASIDSRNASQSIIFKTGFINRIGNSIRTKLIMDNEYSLVKSENYIDNKDARNIASLTAIAELYGNSRFNSTLLLKEILHGNSFLIPDFSAALQYRVINDKDFYLKTNYSRSSKLPSMNDLFWSPGGNPDLMNEYANMMELMVDFNHRISEKLLFKTDLAIYHNILENMIQWHPGNYSYWVADNIKNVNTSGIESSLSFDYALNEVSTSIKLNYTYTKATTKGSEIQNDESIGKQLIYVPEHQANAIISFNYSGFNAFLLSDFTGRRYTTVDNSHWLPGYFLNSLSTGYVIHHKSDLYSINLTVDNLFNTSYQTIAYYPQPGRSYSLKLLIQFSK